MNNQANRPEAISLTSAAERVLLGEELVSIHDARRSWLCAEAEIDAKEDEGAFRTDADQFLRDLCRELAEKHAGRARIAVALRRWLDRSSDYEAWDALMSAFDFDGRDRMLARGMRLFPGMMTSHWQR